MPYLRSTRVLVGAAVLLVGGQALANTSDLLDTLHNNRVITDSQYAQLKKQDKKKAEYMPKFGSEIQLDAPISVSNGDQLGSSTLLRRLYIGASGKISKDWSYKAKFGFIKGSAGVASGTINYTGFKSTAIAIGYMKEPFSLDYATAPTQTAFNERALPTALVPGKQIGVQLGAHGKLWTLAGGVFGSKYNVSPSGDPSGDAVQSRFGGALRGTLVPVHTDSVMWEVGASGSYREADSTHSAKFKSLPEEDTVGANMVSASVSDVNNIDYYGGETGVFAGPVSVQGEYIGTKLNRGSGDDVTFSGWYAQATWTLTGEARRFSPSKGKVLGVKPRSPMSAGGIGAWELAVRASDLDLNDEGAGVMGGEEKNTTVGLNWYPEKSLRFALDYTHVKPIDGGAYNGVGSDIVQARAQASF